MRRLTFITILFFCLSAFCKAQDVSVVEVKELQFDTSASVSPRNDSNGFYCALLLVDAPSFPGLNFEGGVVGSVAYTDGIYKVYIPAGTKSVTAYRSGQPFCSIDFVSYAIKVRSAVTYKAVLRQPGGGVSVSTGKLSARVSLDGVLMGMSPLTLYEISPGQHTITVERYGMGSVTREVEVVNGQKTDIDIDMAAEIAAQKAASATTDINQAAANAEAAAQKAAVEAAALKLAAEQAAREKLAAEQAAAEQAAREAAEKLATEQAAKEQAAREAAEKLAAEQAAREKLAAEQAAKEQAAREAAAKLATEQAAKEQAAREAAEKLASEQAAQKAAAEQAAREKLAAEQAAKEQAAREAAAKTVQNANTQTEHPDETYVFSTAKPTPKPLPQSARNKSFGFVLANVGYSQDLSAGLMAGWVKTFGFYVKGKSDFRFVTPAYSCMSNGVIGTNANSGGPVVWTKGKDYAQASRWNFTAGAVVRACNFLYPYAGLGYGSYKYYWMDSENRWVNVHDATRNGIAVDAGAMFKLGSLMLSAGVNYCGGCLDGEIGIGISF